jgi:uncharacterized repeat protein (TIGR01451 family)
VALSLAAAPVASATTYTVNTTADTNAVNPAVGPQDSSGNTSLRSAIEALNTVPGSSDLIHVPAGTYTLTTAGGAGQGTSGELVVSDSNGIKISGAGASSTTIDPNYIDRAFEIDQGTAATISGVTIKHGRAGADLAGHTGMSCPATAPAGAHPGGAILDQGTLTLKDDVFRDNMAAGNGGAVEDEGGLTVTGSIFSANNACSQASFASFLGVGNGGAIDESSFTNWSVDSSTISGNLAQADGGGLSESAIADPTLKVTNSTIANNHSDVAGGGIVGEGSGTVSLFADTLNGNTATGDGGGIAGNDQDQVVNSTITNNFAGCSETDAAKCTDSSGSGEGGGIENAGSAVTISFSTINDNTAEGGNGGNLANGDSATFTLDDSIVTGGVADDSPENCSGFAFTSNGKNLFDDNGTNCGAIGSDLKNAHPKLGALANNGGPTKTEALQTGSPALDAGDDAKCASETKDPAGHPVDQRFFKRPEGAHCDIGAFEATPDVGVTGSVDQNPIFVGQQDTVTWVVGNSGPPGAEDVTFTDPGSANFSIDSVQTSKGSCSHTTKTVHCALGLIGPGGHVTIKLSVTGLAKGKIVLNASAKTSDDDQDQGNNHASLSITVKSRKSPATADPAITDAVSPTQVETGQSFTWTLTVSNNGPDTDSHVTVTDRLPKGVKFQSVSSGQGHCSDSGQAVSCALGQMASGAGTKIEIKVTGVDVGQQTDAAKVKGAVHDTNTHNNHASATAVVVPPGKATIGIGKLSAACYAKSSTVNLTVSVKAPAGIKKVVFKLSGHTIRTYTPAGHPTSKKLHLVIHGPSLVAGRTYTLGAFVLDTLGRQTHDTANFTICKTTKPKRGFTG